MGVEKLKFFYRTSEGAGKPDLALRRKVWSTVPRGRAFLPLSLGRGWVRGYRVG